VWQWWNFCKGKVANGRTVLRVSLGETAVRIFQGDQKGNVFVAKKRPRDEPVQHISKGKRRCYLAHVALVCGRTDLQPSLPQVIVGNEGTFLAGGMSALATARPANVRLVRQKSARIHFPRHSLLRSSMHHSHSSATSPRPVYTLGTTHATCRNATSDPISWPVRRPPFMAQMCFGVYIG
jgi:hypothetical protein